MGNKNFQSKLHITIDIREFSLEICWSQLNYEHEKS